MGFCLSWVSVLLHIYIQTLKARMKGLGLEVMFSVLPVMSNDLGRTDVSHSSRPGYVAGVTGMALAIGPSCRNEDRRKEMGSISQREGRASLPTGFLT